MLFEKRTRKAVKVIWMILSILIVISMLLFFAPGLTQSRQVPETATTP